MLYISKEDFSNIVLCTKCNSWRGHLKDTNIKDGVCVCPKCGDRHLRSSLELCADLLKNNGDEKNFLDGDCRGCASRKECPNHKKEPIIAIPHPVAYVQIEKPIISEIPKSIEVVPIIKEIPKEIIKPVEVPVVKIEEIHKPIEKMKSLNEIFGKKKT